MMKKNNRIFPFPMPAAQRVREKQSDGLAGINAW